MHHAFSEHCKLYNMSIYMQADAYNTLGPMADMLRRTGYTIGYTP